MNQLDLLDDLRKELPEHVLVDAEWDALRCAVRNAFEFAEFLSALDDHSEIIRKDVDRVAAQLVGGVHLLHEMASVTEEVTTVADWSAFEKVQYMNGTTVASAGPLVDLRKVALDIVQDTRPIPLKWPVYPGVVELKAEFLARFSELCAPDAGARDRVTTLLHLGRLQMVFLANTF